LVQVLGVNQDRSWAAVKSPLSADRGWLPLHFITVHSRIADIPVYTEQAPSPANQPTSRPTFQPAHPPVNKLVLQLASGGEIIILNSDGTGLKSLGRGIDPVLSPDGQTVAFTRWQGDNGSLWLIDADGSNEKSILGFTKRPKGPDWSPDGARIVFNYQHEGRLEKKTICHDVSEGDPGDIPWNSSDHGVSFDPAKGDVDFCYSIPPDPHWGLRVVNIANGSFEDLDGGAYAFRPAWDPVNDWRIVSDGGRGLLAVDVSNQIQPQKLTENLDDSSPVFSPDGRFIVFSTGQLGGGSQGYDIYRLNSDGSGRVRLTNTPLWVTVQPDRQQAWNNVAPAWSPDGSRIAFLTDRTGRWEVWVMTIDGHDPQPMFSEKINGQLNIQYNFVDERVISWR
jgi:TolB protein